MISRQFISSTLALLGALLLTGIPGSGLQAENPPVIDDHAILHNFSKFLDDSLAKGSATAADKLRDQLKRRKTSLKLPQQEQGKFDYTRSLNGIVVLAATYKCPNCSRTHNSTASAWTLTADGVLASNYHVFEDTSRRAFGVATRDGKYFPVTEILAADPVSDVALFRVTVPPGVLTPLQLAGSDAPVGSPVHVVSHPDGRFFTYTAGTLSRYYLRKKDNRTSTWISITADYAKGSSGGPVMNDAGEVVGMVANTSTIYYKNKGKGSSNSKSSSQGPVQMVIKNCVPALSLRALID